MRTVEKTLYKFNELSDKAKEKARDWYRSCIESHDYDCVIEDAVTVAMILGIDISYHSVPLMGGGSRQEPDIWWSGFSSQGDGACFEGTYSYAKGCVKKIREYAPQDTVLHQIADGLYELQRHRKYRVWAKVSQALSY